MSVLTPLHEAIHFTATAFSYDALAARFNSKIYRIGNIELASARRCAAAQRSADSIDSYRR